MAGERALRGVTSRNPNAISVIGCGLGRHQRAFVIDGLRQRAEYEFVDTYDRLELMLPTLRACDAFILAAQDVHGRNALPVVERIAREWPGSAIVVFCPPSVEGQVWIRSLALAGAHQFVFQGVNDTAATLAQAVENARRECVADDVAGKLAPLVPVSLHSMLHMVLARPDDMISVEALAESLGVHRKTLVNRCAREGFPPPAELIVWCRLTLVAHALEHTGATVESIALTLGFPSHTALRNLIKRYTGLRATDIRNGGGVSVVLEALERRLAGPAEALPIP